LDESTSSRLTVTELGRIIFGDKGDPYLEHPGSLWILHWHLAALPGAPRRALGLQRTQ